jgi:hypothetical protein
VLSQANPFWLYAVAGVFDAVVFNVVVFNVVVFVVVIFGAVVFNLLPLALQCRLGYMVFWRSFSSFLRIRLRFNSDK